MTQNLAFLPLTFDTIGRLSGLATAAHKTHLVLPAGRLMAQGLKSPENMTFGVFKNGTAVGLLSLDDPRVMDGPRDLLAGDCLDIWQILVDGAHEGQGIGRAMVDFTKSYSGLIGLKGVVLTTQDKADHNASGFYEKQGFKPTGRRPEDDLELIWRP